MVLKSNFIFDPDTSIEVFMDNVREVEGQHSREIVTYQESQEPVVDTVARYRFPSVTQYRGTVQTSRITNKRKLVYLNSYASNTIVVDGGNSNAIYGHVENLRMADSNTSACVVEFTTRSKGGVSGQFYNSDDCTSTGSQTVDSDGVGGYAEVLDASGEKIYFDLTQNDYELPAGDYKIFARVKDTAQVADDVKMEVYNTTDASSVASDTFTATAAYGYVVLDFTTDSTEGGDSIRFSCEKATATANSLSVDFLVFVKV